MFEVEVLLWGSYLRGHEHSVCSCLCLCPCSEGIVLFGEPLCLKNPELWSKLKLTSSSELRSDFSFSLSVWYSNVSRCCGLACNNTGMLGTLGSVLLAELLRSSLGLVGPRSGPRAAFMVCSL